MDSESIAPDVVPDVDDRELVQLSVRFAHSFLRFLDGTGSDGLSYPRLCLLETLHCQGPAKMKTLADGLGLSARNLTAMADSLECEGLVRRLAHPTDRRATLLELTCEGQAAAEASLAPRLAEITRVFGALSPSARDGLRSALTTLVEATAADHCPSVGGDQIELAGHE